MSINEAVADTDAQNSTKTVIQVDGIGIYYERFEGEGTPVLILHGWGADSSVMRVIYDNLVARGRSAVCLDFPYFGKSGKPREDFTVYSYAELTAEFVRLLGIESVIIIGHSFGGRVGIILAAQKKIRVKKLVLIDAAGCKPKRSLRYRMRVLIYKVKKRLKLNTAGAGSADYKSLEPYMRGIFVRVVNEHLEPLMKKIDAPALLIWGEDDTDTPLYMAKRMNRLIRGSGLVTLQNASHFSFLQRPREVNLILDAFV